MDTLLNILQSAEQSLAAAEANLARANEMNIDHQVTEKILPLMQKFDEVRTALEQRKHKVLELLVQLALLVRETEYEDAYNPGFLYVIRSAQSIQVQRTRREILLDPIKLRSPLNGNYGLRKFAACSELSFYSLCGRIVQAVTEFIGRTPREQSHDIQQLSRLLEQVHSLLEVTQAQPT